VSIDLRLMAKRVTEGDTAAYRAIVEHTQTALYRLAARMLGDLAEAEDTLQDAYIKAYRALCEGRYDGRSKVETWLYRITANTCLDALRRRKGERIADGLDPEAAASAATQTAEFDGAVTADARIALHELDAQLARLPAMQRAVVVLTAVEGLSAREVGEVLGCSQGAVEQRLVRARAALRETWDGDEGVRPRTARAVEGPARHSGAGPALRSGSGPEGPALRSGSGPEGPALRSGSGPEGPERGDSDED
jgi:RNA polymerase sigma-70 factor (ECF subfamily)